MKNPRTLLRLLSAAALAAASLPAAAQVDVSKLVWIGDSLGAGYSASCLTKRVQVDSAGAVIARANGGADYQQPIMGDPGLGGCLILTSLAPSFGKEASVVKPENLALPRPYNNLAIGGCEIHDMVYATTGANASAGTCRNTIDLVLRNSTFNIGSQVDQAVSLGPTFVILANFGNDYFGAVLSGTAIDGVTVTPLASFAADTNAAVAKLKARQPKGLVAGVVDITNIPFTTTILPVLTSGGKVVLNPATGQAIPLLGPKGCPTGVPACPVDPKTTLVTLNAAAYLPLGYGIPCAVAPTLPKCNNPLPDSQDAAGNPGVLLYADEVALLNQRRADYNAATKAAAEANGYLYYDPNGLLNRLKAGIGFGGATISAAFLTGGAISYDGFHLTPIGYALLADDMIQFINANMPGANLHRPDLSVYIYQGGTAGGLAGPPPTAGSPQAPFSWSPLTDAEKADAIEKIFTPDFARELAAMIPAHRATVTAGPAAPARTIERAPRIDSMP